MPRVGKAMSRRGANDTLRVRGSTNNYQRGASASAPRIRAQERMPL